MLKKFLLVALSSIFAVALVIIGLLIGLLFWSSGEAFRGATFNKEEWAANGECEANTDDSCSQQRQRCPRGAMVQDLRQNFLHTRETSKSEVAELIGEHDTIVVIGGEQCEAHYLGMCSAMSLDGDSLYVCYDQNDTIDRSGYIRH